MEYFAENFSKNNNSFSHLHSLKKFKQAKKMKKHFQKLAVVACLFAAACSPKTADKTAKTAPAKTSQPTTVIPMPTGDVRKSAPKPGSAPTINIGKAETFELENGLKVIVVENHKLPKIGFQIFVDHDPVSEGEAAGYIDMFGDLLGKGTSTRSKDQLDSEVDFMGASLNTSARGITGECLTRHADKLLVLMSDVLLHPTFPETELEKSKKRTLSGLESQKANADAIASNVRAVLNFTKFHPYGEVLTEQSLGKINIEQVRKHYQTYFKPNASYLVITGDVNRKQAEKFAKKYFSSWQRGDVPKHVHPNPPELAKTQVDFVHKAGAVQSVVNITHPVALSPASPDAIRARLMNTLLGGYFNSRVNANLREKHAYTYGANTSLQSDEVIGSFNASASVRNAVTDSAVLQFLYELGQLRDVKVPAKELQLVKNVLTGSFSRSLEEPETVARFALNTARFKLPADYYEKYLAVLNDVSADEIQQMARKYINPAQAHILVVGNREEVAEKLRKFSPDKKINFWDTHGEPERQRQALPDGVTAETVLTDYVRAIGGADAVRKIQDVETSSDLQTGGPVLKMKTVQKLPNKFFNEVLMNNQVMSKQILNGEKAMEYGMGGMSRAVEGTALAVLKENSLPCKEASYLPNGYSAKLLGIEEVEGKMAYQMEITRPDGSKFMEYYELATSLKLREVQTSEEAGQKITTTTDFSDYRAVGGVLFPHVYILSGVMPTPMKSVVTEIKVNSGVADSVFEK